jgi:hypothetical protein
MSLMMTGNVSDGLIMGNSHLFDGFETRLAGLHDVKGK